MLEGIPLNVVDLGGWGVCVFLMVLIVTAFVRGWIHPNSTVQAFKSAWETSQAANVAKDEALAELVQHSRTTVKILEALQDRAGGGST